MADDDEAVELLPVDIQPFVIYLAGFEQIHHLSQGLDSLRWYRDYPNAFAEFSCWSSDSDVEDVYTPLPSIEIEFPGELLEPRDAATLIQRSRPSNNAWKR